MKDPTELYDRPRTQIRDLLPVLVTSAPTAIEVPYNPYKPDYKATFYPGVTIFRRNVIPGLNVRDNPGQDQLLRIGLQNVVGTQFKANPTGASKSLRALISNPFAKAQGDDQGNYTVVQPVIDIAGAQAIASIPASVRRDRERF